MRKEPQVPIRKKCTEEKNVQLVPVERLEEAKEATLLGAVAVAGSVGRALSWGSRSLGEDASGGRDVRRRLASRGSGGKDKGGEGLGGSSAGGNGAGARWHRGAIAWSTTGGDGTAGLGGGEEAGRAGETGSSAVQGGVWGTTSGHLGNGSVGWLLGGDGGGVVLAGNLIRDGGGISSGGRLAAGSL